MEPVAQQQTPVERVFAHWVFMLGKNAARTALGPTRRKVIERALALYAEDDVLAAIEGCAASQWHAGENDRGRAFDDLELILRDEAHVERFAESGHALRERLIAQTPSEAPQPARLSRRLKHFPIVPSVSIAADDKGTHFVLSLVAADRPGLLYAVAKTLAAHGATLHTAKIATLGERVEDTFLIGGGVKGVIAK